MEQMLRCPNCKGASMNVTVAVAEGFTTAQCGNCGREFGLDFLTKEQQRRVLEVFRMD